MATCFWPRSKSHTHRQRSVDKHAPVAYGTAVPHGRLSIGPDGTIMVTRAAYTHPLTQKHTHTHRPRRTHRCDGTWPGASLPT